RRLLSWKPRHSPESDAKSSLRFPEVTLPPAPYELSDAVLRLIGPLWGDGSGIDPFFVSAFAEELCGPIPGERLVAMRERSVERFEEAVFSSSFSVFIALHLGYTELEFLKDLR